MPRIEAGPDGARAEVVFDVDADVEVTILTDATLAGPGRRRRSRTGRGEVAADSATPEEALLAGLAEAGFDVVGDATLAPPERRRGLRAPGSDPAVHVAVPPGESAVLLVEGEGGTFAWVQPDEAADGAPGRRAVAAELTFTLAPREGPRRRSLGAAIGWALDLVTRPVRVRVLRFAARLTIDALVSRIEGGNATGPILITGRDPAAWRPGPSLVPPASHGAATQVLLLVHGTFSSTAGSFGHLARHPDGIAFLDAAQARYDAVLGFDHKTLAEDAETNAEALMDVLAGLPESTVIDAVAFSRGGLVFRILVEELLPIRRPDIVLRRAIFVGCTNAGTHLAHPANWEALADLYTNVLMAGARLVTFMTGGSVLDPFVRLGIKTLGEFVQMLPQVGVTDRRVPGLASMDPDGPTVGRLNGAAARPGPPAQYYAITSDFAATFDPAKGLSRELCQLLLDRVTNDLWQGAQNDLVVDTASMTSFGSRAKQLAADATFPFGSGERIYHIVYFAAAETAARLRRWLELPAPMAAVAESGRLGVDLPVPPDLQGIVADIPRPAARPPRRTRGGGGTSASGASDQAPKPSAIAVPTSESTGVEEDVSCRVAAAMPETAPVGEAVELQVTLSQEEIATPAGSARAEAALLLRPRREVRVQVAARANCDVLGSAEETVPPPAAGRPEVLVFRIRGRAAGDAELWLDVFQGARRLTRLVLQPRFVASGSIEIAAPVVSAEADPPLLGVRIFEEALGDSAWRLRFVASSQELGIESEHVTGEFRIDKVEYLKDLYKSIEGAWADTEGDFQPLMRQLRAKGAELFRSLVPKELQQILWANRERIGSIQVFSSEPSIPWEVAHLVEPDRAVPLSGGMFLSELGLTRWISNVGIAPARLRLRPGKALTCVPSYLNPGYNLDSAAEEERTIRELLGAAPLDPHLDPVLSALARAKGEDYDALHFVCHGSTDAARVWDAGLLLAGFRRNGKVAPEELTAESIRAYAGLQAADGMRPLVFLNACQSGVGGRTLSGAGGLARAFVERGAGLFVGTLWSVGDTTAFGFATAFYQALKDGRTVTQAARAARERAKQDQEATWLAYTVYGHPYARISA